MDSPVTASNAAGNDFYQRRGDARASRNHVMLLSWIGPSVIPLAVLIAVPVALLFYVSLTSFKLGYPWSEHELVGLANYYRLFSGRELNFLSALKLSIMVTVISVAFKTLLGLCVALLLNRKLPAEHLLVALIILPLAVNPAIAGLMWKLMFSYDFGIINALASRITGNKVVWLGQSYALFSVIIVLVWMHFPLSAFIFLAGLRSIPPETLEAARLDGCSSRQLLWWIVLPQLKPVIVSSSLFQGILAFQAFGPIYTMTDGGPGNATEILPLFIYKVGFDIGAIGISAAAAITLVLIIMTLSVVIMITGRQKQ